MMMERGEKAHRLYPEDFILVILSRLVEAAHQDKGLVKKLGLLNCEQQKSCFDISGQAHCPIDAW